MTAMVTLSCGPANARRQVRRSHVYAECKRLHLSSISASTICHASLSQALSLEDATKEPSPRPLLRCERELHLLYLLVLVANAHDNNVDWFAHRRFDDRHDRFGDAFVVVSLHGAESDDGVSLAQPSLLRGRRSVDCADRTHRLATRQLVVPVDEQVGPLLLEALTEGHTGDRYLVPSQEEFCQVHRGAGGERLEQHVHARVSELVECEVDLLH
mmetsp:Transcript_37189/g.98440  ORF Transcript_37189/g.98440 Transcript_37189/m.98440 type:complete len:214 (-) Transcript_37189:929-1570(-)